MAAASGLPVLTSAKQVRSLTLEESRRRYPVHLRGTVTYYEFFGDKRYSHCFIQDESGGIYLDERGVRRDLRAGQIVEVEGFTSSGSFAPEVIEPQVKVVGEGPMPSAQTVTIEEMLSGKEDAQWVQVRGMVRTVVMHMGFPEFEIMVGGKRFAVRVTAPNIDPAKAEAYVDSEVMATGVCGPIFNTRRQLFNVRLHSPTLDCLQVIDPPRQRLFDIPRMPIGDLFRFTPDASYGHRVKVQGTVVLEEDQTLFLCDPDGVQVQTRQSLDLSPGDQVEAVGFSTLGEYSPVLEDAVVRKIGSTVPPQARKATFDQLQTGNLDSELVQADARLIERVKQGDELLLVMQGSNAVFNAQVTLAPADKDASLPQVGSELRLTGVCVVELHENWRPKGTLRSFRLLLRSLQDVAVLREPPWWTWPRLLAAMAILAGIVVLAVIWIVVLRGQVRVQTAIIGRKIEREAALEERSRIARDLHDSLEQGLSAILIQLDLASALFGKTPEVALRGVETARNLSRRCLEEARRSICDLRSFLLEQNDLPAALREIAQLLIPGDSPRVEVQIIGQPCKLPLTVESHLLRICQESIANAVKHGNARTLKIELTYDPQLLRLRVRDDGCGFEYDPTRGLGVDHFGLVHMRERARKIGGGIAVHAAPGQGTEVVVEVPAEKFNRTEKFL